MTNLIVKTSISLKEALIKLGRNQEKCLLAVSKKGQFEGTLNDGDIRRALIKGADSKGKLKHHLQRKPFYLTVNEFKKNSQKQIIYLLNKKKLIGIDVVPVLDKEKKIKKILTLEKFQKRLKLQNEYLTPVVLMAGGKGTRLKPFTNFFPKILMPFSNTTAGDFIISHFRKFGFKNFMISVNHKKQLIKSYFAKSLDVNFIEEKKFLGTIGSLSLIREINFKNLICINCDTIITSNISKILEFHIKNKNDLTLVAASKKFKIPYGYCNINKNKKFLSLVEKPESSYLVNVGLYILKKELINLIPKSKKYDVTELLGKTTSMKKKIGVFPISVKNWIDIGTYEKS